MARGYTKEFLVDAFVSRYEPLGSTAAAKQRELAETLWDRVTKEQFRQYCNLDAEAIRAYKQIML
jgi:hypothetical protein